MIRQTEEKDIDKILDLLNQVLLVHHEIRPDIFKAKGYKYDKEELIHILHDENYVCFVYVDENDVPLGHIFCINRTKEEDHSRYLQKFLYIDDLVVDDKCRHQGIGKALIDYVYHYAKQHHYQSIRLSCYAGNDNALKFYHDLGLNDFVYQLEKKIK